MKISISFILPIYNVAPYLAEAIESILRQNVPKEIILVDDGSTDESLNIALTYARQYPFIYVIHSQNKGVSAARNAGLRLAKGEYVLFLDPDDEIAKDIDINMVHQIGKKHNINVIKGLFTGAVIDKNIKQDYLPIHHEVKGQTAKIFSLNEALELAYLGSWFVQIGCLLIRRNFLLENNLLFNESLSFAEDTIFILFLFSLNGDILELPKVILDYKIRKTGIVSNVTNKRIESTALAIKEIEEKKKDITDKKIKHYFNIARAMLILYLKNDIESSNKFEKYNHLISLEMKELVMELKEKGIKYIP